MKNVCKYFGTCLCWRTRVACDPNVYEQLVDEKAHATRVRQHGGNFAGIKATD
jgi:hypothetical protein